MLGIFWVAVASADTTKKHRARLDDSSGSSSWVPTEA